MLEMLLFLIVAYIPINVIGIASPLLAKKSIIFGVSIPPAYIRNERIETTKSSYMRLSIGFSIAGLLLFVVFQPWLNESRFTAALITAIVYSLVLHTVTYLVFYTRVKRIKQEQGWQQEPAGTQKVSIDISFHTRKKVYSNAWYLIHLAIVLSTAAYLASIYNSIPDVMATHYDLQGNADGFSNKSFMTVFDLSFMQLFMIGLFMFCNWLTDKSKQQTDPLQPEKSMANTIVFRKLSSLFLLVLGFLIVAFFSLLKLGSVAEVSTSFTGISSISFIVVLVAVCTFFIIRMIAIKRTPFKEEITAVPMDADHYWKLGMIYFNPADPALFVEKRQGIGYTVNMGRPVSWIFVIVLIAMVVLIEVLANKTG